MTKPARPTLAVVGALGFDHIETARGEVVHDLGGSAAYAALAASFLARPVLLSRVGKDVSTAHRQLLLDHGVDLTHLQIDPQHLSFSWTAKYDPDGDARQTLALHKGAFGRFSPRWPAGLRAKAIQLGSIPPPFQIDLLRSLPFPCPFAFDSFPHWIKEYPDHTNRLCQQATVISLNEEEVCLLADQSDARSAARQLFHRFQPRVFLLKQGSRGAMCLTRQEAFHMPAAALPSHSIPEPTGAGDSLIAAFLTRWDPQNPDQPRALRSAVAFASAVAAATVSGPGLRGLLAARLPALQQQAATLLPQCRLL